MLRPASKSSLHAETPRVSRFNTIRRVAVTGSTNDDVAAVLGLPETGGTTVLADYQQRGAGRKGRSWIAPPGSALLFTTALPEALPSEALWAVPFWTALVVQAALRDNGVETSLQWPNDVLLHGRKIAGILCISRITGDRAWAAFGVGINIVRPPHDRDIAQIVPPPAFVSDVASADRERILQGVLQHADRMYECLASPQQVARDWECAAGLPGVHYRLRMDGDDAVIDARAVRLSPAGALVIDENGTERAIALADARVLRE